MSEVEVYRTGPAASLPARVQYARELANSGLLPTAYRRNPPNILWAMEYGDMLGLSHMAAITGVHVIEGKPTASAGLISALVRRAGHKLRVHGDNTRATCQIIRSDDPDYTFEVTWTLRRNTDGHPSAEEAGLLNKGTWKNYPASMLKSRAITQCARDACEEALYGLHYTPEELGADVDEDGDVVGEPARPNGHHPAGPGNGTEGTSGDLPDPADAPAEDPWATPEGGEDWVDGAIEQASALTGKDAAQTLYRQAVAKAEAGEITAAQKEQVCSLIIAQMEHIASAAPPVEGTVSAPDGDPWSAKVEEITSPQEAADAIAELDQAHADGHVDSRRHKALRAAMAAKGAAKQGAAA